MQGENKTWKKISDDTVRNSRKVYVLHTQYEKWETIKREHSGNYYMTSVMRAIYALGSVAVGRRFQTEKMIFDGAAIHYALDEKGDVRIFVLEVNGDYKPESGQQLTGLYQVSYSSRLGVVEPSWNTLEDTKTKMALSHRWNNAHYAAVSGKFDSKEAAGRMLIEHISQAYKAAVSERDTHQPDNHYSLYWQNGGHKSNKQRDHLVSLIQQAMVAGAPVNWLVHGEGAGTFASAMKVLENKLTPAPVADERKKELRENLRLQKVFFSNPRGKSTRKEELKAQCEKVGFCYLDTNINPNDMFNPDARGKALLKGAAVGGAIGLGGFSSTLGAEDIVKSFTQAVGSNSLLLGAGALIAGYFVVRDKVVTNSGYLSSLPKAVESTFGKGNQRWAT